MLSAGGKKPFFCKITFRAEISHSSSQVNMKSLPLTPADERPWASLLAITSGKSHRELPQQLANPHPTTAVSWGTWDGDTLVASFTACLIHLNCPQQSENPRIALAQAPVIHPRYDRQALYETVTQPVIESLRRQDVQAIFQVDHRPLWASLRQTPPGYQFLGRLYPYWGWLNERPTAVSLRLTTRCPAELTPIPPHTQITFMLDIEDVRERYCRVEEAYQFALWQEGAALKGLVVYKVTKHAFAPSVAHLVAVYGADTPRLLTRWLATMYDHGHRLIHTVTSPHAAVRHALRQHTQQINGRLSPAQHLLYAQPLQRYVSSHLLDLNHWNWVN